MVEGRRPAGGKVSSNARPGLSAGYCVSPTLRAYGSGVHGPPKPRTSIAFDLRQEPGAGKRRRENGESNPRFKRGKPGEMLPGQPSYRTVKALWDKSMMVKRGLGEHARPNALQGPRDMVKDVLLEPQSPAMETHIPRHGMSGRGRQDRTVSLSPSKTPPAERRPTRPFKGTNRGPKSR
jgi:hypothetical protein